MIEQRSPEWFQQRKGRITGSRVGAILGVSQYDGPEDVMRSMVRDYFDEPSEFTGNIATRWGTEKEPEAIKALEEKTQQSVEEVGFIIHPEHEWLGASPDGLQGEYVIEAKCPFRKEMFVPSTRTDYMAQIQVQMACTGLTKCRFVVWVPDYSEVYEYDFDPQWWDESWPRLLTFYQRYIDIISDPEKAGPYRESREEVVMDSLDWFEAADQYHAASIDVEQAKSIQAQAKDKLLKLAAGKKSRGDGLLVYPVKGRKTVNYRQALKDHCPDLDLEEYSKTGAESWSIKDV